MYPSSTINHRHMFIVDLMCASSCTQGTVRRVRTNWLLSAAKASVSLRSLSSALLMSMSARVSVTPWLPVMRSMTVHERLSGLDCAHSTYLLAGCTIHDKRVYCFLKRGVLSLQLDTRCCAPQTSSTGERTTPADHAASKEEHFSQPMRAC
jgi:hypothetical protein